MWLTPHSPESDSTIYISSPTPVSSHSHSFPTTPVKLPPRDLQNESRHKAAEFKAQSNICYENKKYTEAIELYSMAISYVPSDYVSFSKNVIFSLPHRQPSSLLPLTKQNCTCSERSFLYHAIESAIPAGILPSGKVLFPHQRPRKYTHYVLERTGIGLTQRYPLFRRVCWSAVDRVSFDAKPDSQGPDEFLQDSGVPPDNRWRSSVHPRLFGRPIKM